jgi:hypothetical protein
MSTNRRLRDWLTAWPVYRQLTTGDRTARGTAT